MLLLVLLLLLLPPPLPSPPPPFVDIIVHKEIELKKFLLKTFSNSIKSRESEREQIEEAIKRYRLMQLHKLHGFPLIRACLCLALDLGGTRVRPIALLAYLPTYLPTVRLLSRLSGCAAATFGASGVAGGRMFFVTDEESRCI